MTKFRKKPVVIEAEKYSSESQENPAGVIIDDPTDPYSLPYVQTLEGPMCVSDGDWIITGVSGEKYPCKNHIFEVTYDPVDSDTPVERL